MPRRSAGDALSWMFRQAHYRRPQARMRPMRTNSFQRPRQGHGQIDIPTPQMASAESDLVCRFWFSRAGCPFRNSYPDVMVMQTAEDRNGHDGADPLDRSTERCIFL